MGLHTNTVLINSCLKVPVNPTNKLPLASYERINSKKVKNKVQSPSPEQDLGSEKNPLSFREFYKSIPDYKDVNHLSNQEFYLTLENLRENKLKLLVNAKINTTPLDKYTDDILLFSKNKNVSTTLKKHNISDKYDIAEKYIPYKHSMGSPASDADSLLSIDNRRREKSQVHTSIDKFLEDNRKLNPNRNSSSASNKIKRKTISPSCSVSWNNDLNILSKFENENKYTDRDNFDSSKNITLFNNDDASRKSYSVPTSPIKQRASPKYSSANFWTGKYSEREGDVKIMNKLKDYSDELEYLYLVKDKQNKQFRANPVPIESRIPLYDKILEDQELRRSISKLQSKAELQAQMKPFSFTEREEKWEARDRMGCSRLCRSNPQLSLITSPSESSLFRTKKFKAKPIPKNLFSNYIYEKMREDDFYRALNRRIRAEEMLKASSLPPSMAKREKGQSACSSASFQKYLSNNEISSESNSPSDSKRNRKSRSRKRTLRNILSREKNLDKELENLKYELNASSSRSQKSSKNEHEEEIKKIYGSNSSDTVTASSGYATRPRSAADVSAINKSNLAAILRIESSKKKLEAEVIKQLEEERYQSEIKWRDSVLRRKPAWKSLKYSHSDDLAMRLQMRKDEERYRREQFLHEMELMYGRVHDQPMMFERCYSPPKATRMKPDYSLSESGKKKKSKPRSALSKHILAAGMTSPNRLRKVSINENAETIGDEIDEYILRNSDNDSISKLSDEISESIPDESQIKRKESK